MVSGAKDTSRVLSVVEAFAKVIRPGRPRLSVR
jgi:hypothetical protein